MKVFYFFKMNRALQNKSHEWSFHEYEIFSTTAYISYMRSKNGRICVYHPHISACKRIKNIRLRVYLRISRIYAKSAWKIYSHERLIKLVIFRIIVWINSRPPRIMPKTMNCRLIHRLDTYTTV